jgi:hypothetical protein
VGLTVVGGVLLILGWFGVSGQGLTSEQIPYVVSGGLGGIFLMGVGAALWLSADLRDEWSKLDRIEKVLEGGLEQLGLGRGSDGRPTLAALERDGSSPKALVAAGSANGNSIGDPGLDDTRETAVVPVAARRPRTGSSKLAGSPTSARGNGVSKRTSRAATKTDL